MKEGVKPTKIGNHQATTRIMYFIKSTMNGLRGSTRMQTPLIEASVVDKRTQLVGCETVLAMVTWEANMTRLKQVKPVPCQHIADYYQFQWLQKPSLGHNLLRHGYRQWSEGKQIGRAHV